MNRFNYLTEPRRLPQTSIAATFAIDNRIRGPLAALVATVLLTACISVIQLSRLQAAQRTYSATFARLAASDASVDTLKRLRARVDAQTRLAQELADARRVSLMHTAELAWIGNHLPSDTWLTALRYEDGKYDLDGTSRRVAAVGNAMLALRDSPRADAPRLVSLHDAADGSAAGIHYTLRLEPLP